MQRSIKRIFLVFIFIVLFRVNSNVYALNFDKACGIKFKDKMQIVVKFETNGGESIQDLNYCRGCGKGKFVLPTPVRKGYIFKGWYGDSKYTSEVGTILDKEETEKKVLLIPYKLGCDIDKAYFILYAKWEKDDKCDIPTSYKVTIKYQTNSDDKFDDLKFTMGEDNQDISLPIPKKEGYHFIGWYGDKNYRTLISNNDNLSGDELYTKVKTEYINDDKCSFDRKGTLYAKYVDDDNLLSMIYDYVDNNIYMVKDIIK